MPTKLENNEILVYPESGIELVSDDDEISVSNILDTIEQDIEVGICSHLEEAHGFDSDDASLVSKTVMQGVTVNTSLKKSDPEPIEKDGFDPSSSHGHFTQTEGYTQDLLPAVSLSVTDPAIVNDLGMGKAEWVDMLAITLSEAGLGEEGDIAVDFGDKIEADLLSIQAKRKQLFDNSFIVLPKEISPLHILSEEACQGVPKLPQIAEARVLTSPSFDAPLYHAHLGQFLPEHLQAVTVAEARELLGDSVLAIKDWRQGELNDLPNYHPRVMQDTFARGFVKAFKEYKDNKFISSFAQGAIMQAGGNDPAVSIAIARSVMGMADRQHEDALMVALCSATAPEQSSMTQDDKVGYLVEQLNNRAGQAIPDVFSLAKDLDVHDRMTLLDQVENKLPCKQDLSQTIERPKR